MNNRISAENLAELYSLAAGRYGDLPAFATRKSEFVWEPVSFRELYSRGVKLAAGLIHLGVNARDHVGLFSDNRFEWILADWGVQLSGAADVPRGRDITDSELVYIINHSRMSVAFIETQPLLERVIHLQKEIPGLHTLILLEQNSDFIQNKSGFNGKLLQLDEVLNIGESQSSDGIRRVDDRVKSIKPDDLFTLIYTSGTTGKPKGVMLTHANIVSQTKSIPVELGIADRILSILPAWHIFERVFEVYAISCGTCTYYTNIRNLADDLKSVEPTFMGSAPRLWEGLHHQILKRVRESHPVRRILFRIACFLSHYYNKSVRFMQDRQLELKPPVLWKRFLHYPFHLLCRILLLPWYGFFNAAVLESVRQSAGGTLKATVSGGGALPEEIDRFFNDIGIPVLEGYGLTETSPVLAVRTPDNLVIGTVGPLLASTAVRIVEPETEKILYPNNKLSHGGMGLKGEIWVKGPQIMKGYYRDPKRTDVTIREGWLRTGDLGMVTFNECLKILGRCKSTVVLRSGENLEPEPIEMRLSQSPLIEYCMVVGQDQKHPGVLIVPSIEGARNKGIDVETYDKLVDNPKLEKLIHGEIKRLVSVSEGFKPYELIRDFAILPETFTPGAELTSLFKLKRHVIEEKYSEVIKDLYGI